MSEASIALVFTHSLTEECPHGAAYRWAITVGSGAPLGEDR